MSVKENFNTHDIKFYNFLCENFTDIDEEIEKIEQAGIYNEGPEVLMAVVSYITKSINLSEHAELAKDFLFQTGMYLHGSSLDSSMLMKSYFNIILLEMKQNNVLKVKILGGCCDGCNKYENAVLQIDEALEKKTLPCDSCEFKLKKSAKYPWCRCCYVAVE